VKREDAPNSAEASAEEVEKFYETNVDSGLTASKANEVLERDGLNQWSQTPKPKSLLQRFLAQMRYIPIIILFTVAIITSNIIVFVILIIKSVWAARTKHKAAKAACIGVLRDGNEIKIEATTVVRGDVVILQAGDVVPADMRLMEAQDLKVSEVALTGERDEVAKSSKLKPKKEGEPEKLTPDNMVFSGCSVTNGRAKGIVTETGMGTRIANKDGDKAHQKKCAHLPDTSSNATPLQENSNKQGMRSRFLAIGKTIGKSIAVCIVFFFIIGTLTEDESDESKKGYVSYGRSRYDVRLQEM